MGRSSAGLVSAAPWLALLVAFSPVLIDLARHLAISPEDRVILFVALLLLLAVRQDRPAETATGHPLGLLVVGLGGTLEILGIVAGSWSIARLGLPVAAVGLASWRGAPRLAVMALAFLAIPLPFSVISLTSPALETALTRAAAMALSVFGLSVETSGASLGAAPDTIHLAPQQGGATLAVALAALGWYAAVRTGAGFGTAAVRAATAAVLALPLQLLVLLVTGALVGLGVKELADFWLRNVGWVVVSGCGLAWISRPERPA